MLGTDMPLVDQVVAQSRIAVAYHRAGPGLGSDFDATVMLRLMDQLGDLIDKLDAE